MDQARLGPASTFTRPRNRLTDCQSSVKELATRSSPNFPWIFALSPLLLSFLPSFFLSPLPCLLVLPDSTLFFLFSLLSFLHPTRASQFSREKAPWLFEASLSGWIRSINFSKIVSILISRMRPIIEAIPPPDSFARKDFSLRGN